MVHQSSEIWTTFFLIVAAVFVVSIFRRLSISSVLGYLVAGMLIGPEVLGIIQDSNTTKPIAEVGVIFLLFTVGLELPYDRLKILRNYILGMGFAQVALTSLVIGAIVFMFRGNMTEAALVGIAVSLSSTAVVLQLLVEKGEMSVRYGRASLAILLFQDFAVVLVLVFLKVIGGQSSFFTALGHAGLQALLVTVGILFFARFVLRPLYRWITLLKNPDLLMGVALIIVLGTSLLTSYGGLSHELGAFLAGLMLAGTEYRHQVEADIQPFRGLLLGLFFMTVGMTIDLSLIASRPFDIMGIILITLIVKGLIIFGISMASKLNPRSSLRLCFLLATGGELLFVVVSAAQSEGMISAELKNILFVTTAVSMSITPFLNSLGRFLTDALGYDRTYGLSISAQETSDFRNHVIIAGFGRTGELIAGLLKERDIPFVAIDNNPIRVVEARKMGYPVFLGDMRRAEVLHTLNADQARVITIAFDKGTGSFKTALMMRRHFPDADICLRVQDEDQAEKLIQAGIKVVFLETLEQSLHVASLVLGAIGLSQAEIDVVVDHVRKGHNPFIQTINAYTS